MNSLSRTDWQKIILIVIGHLILMYWALNLVAPPNNISLMWLPDGYLLGILLLIDKRFYIPLLFILIPSIILFEFIYTNRPIDLIVVFLSANLIESYGAAILDSSIVRNKKKFESFSDLAKFLLLCVLILPSISATIGALMLKYKNPELRFLDIYRTWMLSAGLGILFVAPLSLYTFKWLKSVSWQKVKEHYLLWILIFIEIIAISNATFFLENNSHIYLLTIFFIFPLLIIAAVKYGLFGSLLFSSILVVATIQLTALGNGPFTNESLSAVEAVIKLQSYLALFLISSFFIALATENIRSANKISNDTRRKLQLIFDTVPNGIQVNSLDGTITYSNPAHHRILGYPDGELIGKPIWFAEKDKEGINKLKTYLQHLIKEKPKPIAYITSNNRLDGSTIWLEINWDYEYDVRGKHIGFISIISDITDRKLANEKLQIQLSKNKKTVQTTLDGYVLADQNGDIKDVNPSYSQLIGYNRRELLKMNIKDLEITLSPEEIGQRIQRILKLKADRFETKHRTKNNKIIDLDVSIAILEQNESEFLLAAFVRDITNQKKLTRDLIKAKEKAEESDLLKSEFLKNMSHEIRTPLNGILGFTSMLESTSIDDIKKNRYIEIINNCGDQLLKIIDNILEISALATGQIKVNSQKTYLTDFLTDIGTLHEGKAKKKNLKFSIKNKDFDDISFLIDREKLFKIMSNLIDNAIKFTSKGYIEIDVNLSDKSILLSVNDSGTGISKKYHRTIFNRFTQEKNSTSDLESGLGLGLAIARENAILLGGKITVESTKGEGSKFNVSIPITYE